LSLALPHISPMTLEISVICRDRGHKGCCQGVATLHEFVWMASRSGFRPHMQREPVTAKALPTAQR
jgi:hypothetical protein